MRYSVTPKADGVLFRWIIIPRPAQAARPNTMQEQFPAIRVEKDVPLIVETVIEVKMYCLIKHDDTQITNVYVCERS